MPASGSTVLTIGHSTHPMDAFIDLLQRHGVTVVADVRAAPYSRFNPQFNRESLAGSLDARGIAYVFLGSELGGRSEDPGCYENGRISYGGRIPDFPVTRSHPPASWPSAANSSICRTYRKTAGEESRRRSPVANRWMRP